MREHIVKKELAVEHVSSSNYMVDVLTKPLGFDHFAYMRVSSRSSSMSIRDLELKGAC